MGQQILGLIVPFTTVIFAVILFVLWWRDQSKAHVLGFVVSLLSLGIGFTIWHFAPRHPSLLIMGISHTLYTLSVAAAVWGVCTRVGQKVPVRAFALVWLVSSALILLVGPEGYDLAIVFLVNTTYGLIYALGTLMLSQAAPRSAIDRVVTFFFGLMATQFFVRPPVVMLMQGGLIDENYRETTYYQVFVLSLGAMTLILGMLLVATVVIDNFRTMKADAETDELSGLRMRSGFETAAIEMINQSVTRNVPVSIVVADIDHFKQVNDIWGHQAGDRAIGSFGKLISTMTRSGDLVGRIGGEEFCILAWNCDAEAAANLADRIRLSFARQAHHGINDDIRLTASFGVACWARGEGYGKLFARADAALYRAKDGGRNQVVACEGKHLVPTGSVKLGPPAPTSDEERRASA